MVFSCDNIMSAMVISTTEQLSEVRDTTASTVYLSAAVNQRRLCLARLCPGLLVYGADARLLVYSTKSGRVIGTHSSRVAKGHVTGVRVLSPPPPQTLPTTSSAATTTLVIATHSCGALMVWRLTLPQQLMDDTTSPLHTSTVTDVLQLITAIQGHHKSTVTSLDVTYLSHSPNSILVATSALDSNIALTVISAITGEIIFTHTVAMKQLVLEIKLLQTLDPIMDSSVHHSNANNPHSKYPLVVLGTDDSKVHIWRIISSDVSTEHPIELYEPACVLPGHKDWITTLDVVSVESPVLDHAMPNQTESECKKVLLLASGSKDGTVRVWRVTVDGDDVLGVEKEVCPSVCAEDQLKVEPLKMRGGGSVVLVTVLAGHDGWVSSVRWAFGDAGCLQLISAAQTEDRSIVLWQPQGEDVWLESSRLGEVGGNREGFFSAFLSHDCKELYAHSYQGGLHQWRLSDCGWSPVASPTGHFKPVVDLSWEAEAGHYLLTCSVDQTTRLHSANKCQVWSEVCRPQVHGYDMSCIASISLNCFVSGAEEKVLRGFMGPTHLLSGLSDHCEWSVKEQVLKDEFVEAASVPSLGLSNKSTKDQATNEAIAANPALTDPIPLTEDSLMASSLWPEVSKLYGHGHELMCVAASKTLVASASKAASPYDAVILIWSRQTWKLVQTLSHHRLTVTQLDFNEDGSKLLAVSRDRGWSVWEVSDAEAPCTLLSHSGLLKKDEQHSRIIWSGCWLKGSTNFITVSRDKNIIVWQRADPSKLEKIEGGDDGVATVKWCSTAKQDMEDECTAVAATAVPNPDGSRRWLVAVGLVSGKVSLLQLNTLLESNFKFTAEDVVGFSDAVEHLSITHQDTVRRLAFKPRLQLQTEPSAASSSEAFGDHVMLASCGNDNLTCVYRCQL